MLNDKTILVTGGTGSFGQRFIKTVLEKHKPRKIIVLSRDEFKQHEMSQQFSEEQYPIRYFIGDIRDEKRLYRAFEGVDYIVHAAAMKHVPACEYNPFEAVKTNIIGAQNIVEAAIDRGVKKIIALSSDKAVNPINLYGSTKLSVEKLLIAGNNYVGAKDTLFSLVRYGNVVGSRGSVIPIFLNIKNSNGKEYPVTDPNMTRFWITLDQSVELVLNALENAVGGETFIPKIPSMKIVDLIKAIDPNAKLKIIGIRPGEKIHESLISEDEGRKTVMFPYKGKDHYVILPQFEVRGKLAEVYRQYKSVSEGFIYRSDLNDEWVKPGDLDKLIKTI